jgi:hypothetical protein
MCQDTSRLFSPYTYLVRFLRLLSNLHQVTGYEFRKYKQLAKALGRNDLGKKCLILRIDDFPVGVRPLQDETQIQDFLRAIDSCNVPFVLGIVPLKCKDSDWAFLKTLKNMIPAMHGLEHSNSIFSQLCVQQHDLKNDHTVRQFNELSGLGKVNSVNLLKGGRKLMNDRLQIKVQIYIPPCNRLTFRQSIWVRKSGFQLVMSDPVVNFAALPVIRSDFYGKTFEMNKASGLVTLHATWEADKFNREKVIQTVNSWK